MQRGDWMEIKVIGAGLAGCECAFQLAKRGHKVKLYDIKPERKTEAHHAPTFAELVCSNSFKGEALTSGPALLKEELRMLNSFILEIADKTKIPSGNALAVDREKFSQEITNIIKGNENIEVICEEIKEIPNDAIVVIASGPLTCDTLAGNIAKSLGEDSLYFYDAAAPIIEKDSIDFSKAFYQSRYDKGEADYINIPMSEEEFNVWYDKVINAKKAPIKDNELKFYEGCMPFEEVARRGKQALVFGCMKPTGLGKHLPFRPYAIVQLRQDNAVDTLYNMVGFQTNIAWGDQKEIIQAIPGLENASIARYGVMHRNTFINAPRHLTKHFNLKNNENVYFAGQVTGLEGYNCAIASGLIVALEIDSRIKGESELNFPRNTMIGGLINYITNTDAKSFQPMGPAFGLLEQIGPSKKIDRKAMYSQRALREMEEYVKSRNIR